MDAKLTDTAAALRVRVPTLSVVVKDLCASVGSPGIARLRMTVSCVSLSRRSKALALEIKKQVRRVNATLSEQDQYALGTILKDSRA